MDGKKTDFQRFLGRLITTQGNDDGKRKERRMAKIAKIADRESCHLQKPTLTFKNQSV
jgi:hypothetical protein